MIQSSPRFSVAQQYSGSAENVDGAKSKLCIMTCQWSTVTNEG